MPALLHALGLPLVPLASGAGLSFITVGDWGAGAVEEPEKPYAQNVKDVAAQMARTAAEMDVAFIVNTGDNFYWCGIQNTSDFQIQESWIKPYAAASLQVPWYSVLGNHEYGYNVDAQIRMTQSYTNWVMDSRYFTKRVPLDDSHYATMVFLDTSPCIKEYRSSRASGWDPCGSDYPTCSLSGGSDTFEGDCAFHGNILSQDCGAQHAWLKSTLQAIPKDDWLIVVAHHPASELDVEDLTSTLQAHGFDIYLNGHSHVLTQYKVDGKGAYVTSGAGSLVITHDQLGGTPATDRTRSMVHGHAEDLANASAASSGHSYKADFSARVSGFTVHTFSDDLKTLTTQFLDTKGKVLHSFQVQKGQPGPAPPSPTPSPTPSRSCANRCGEYKRSKFCQCNVGCESHRDCCLDFGELCGSTLV